MLKIRSNSKKSDEVLEAMFGNEKWQIERVISEVELLSKENIVFFSDEIEKHIIPYLKEKDSKDLREGKAVQVVVYDEDTKNSFNLKLTFQQPFYHLSDTTELFEKMELTPGQRIGFRHNLARKSTIDLPSQY
ncbi:hypothetical protein EZV62_012346 [Acer yangbiense]|uniref:Uncharacterized protein n=1 Tax=Acer yangbiense TaxID=1000413 RepID=A0A5C7HV69_9ROSI|nr:hypothetical protein EZV62_012346 [Acer yangbiense]